MKDIDTKILKYIPKILQSKVVYANAFNNGNGSQKTYNVGFEFIGEPSTDVGENGFTDIMADGIEGLKWSVKQVENGRRGEIYG